MRWTVTYYVLVGTTAALGVAMLITLSGTWGLACMGSLALMLVAVCKADEESTLNGSTPEQGT